MRKQLESLLIGAAKSLNWSVSPNVKQARAEEFGAVPSKLVREGEIIPTTQERAKTTGYYPVGPFRKTVEPLTLMIDVDDPGDRTRYALVALCSNDTGHHMPFGHELMSYAEVCAKLRAITDTAYILREQSKGRRK